MPQVMDADRMARALTRIAHEIVERNRGTSDLGLVGIRTRGVPLARRLAATLKSITHEDVPTGALDITLYRDDLMRHPVGPQPVVRRTEIPFSIDARRILLVDDVLYTGRTIRSALDALIDFGRPRLIQLIVLVDRGHRELPIKADYVGKNLPTSPRQSVQVRLQEIDGEDEVLLEDDLVAVIDLLQAHLHALVERGGQVLADVVGLDGQLAVAAVHEDDQLNRLRPPEIDESVERRARRPPGVEHVVHQQNLASVDGKRNLRAAYDRLRPHGVPHQVVAVERDVEGAGRHLVAGDLLDLPGQAPGERHAAAAHADEREIVNKLAAGSIAFEDFVSDAGKAAADAVRIHDNWHVHLFAASQDRS